MNLQYENTKSNGDFELKNGLNIRFNDFCYTKINLNQKYVLHFSGAEVRGLHQDFQANFLS